MIFVVREIRVDRVGFRARGLGEQADIIQFSSTDDLHRGRHTVHADYAFTMTTIIEGAP